MIQKTPNLLSLNYKRFSEPLKRNKEIAQKKLVSQFAKMDNDAVKKHQQTFKPNLLTCLKELQEIATYYPYNGKFKLLPSLKDDEVSKQKFKAGITKLERIKKYYDNLSASKLPKFHDYINLYIMRDQTKLIRRIGKHNTEVFLRVKFGESATIKAIDKNLEILAKTKRISFNCEGGSEGSKWVRINPTYNSDTVKNYYAKLMMRYNDKKDNKSNCLIDVLKCIKQVNKCYKGGVLPNSALLGQTIASLVTLQDLLKTLSVSDCKDLMEENGITSDMLRRVFNSFNESTCGTNNELSKGLKQLADYLDIATNSRGEIVIDKVANLESRFHKVTHKLWATDKSPDYSRDLLQIMSRVKPILAQLAKIAQYNGTKYGDGKSEDGNNEDIKYVARNDKHTAEVTQLVNELNMQKDEYEKCANGKYNLEVNFTNLCRFIETPILVVNNDNHLKTISSREHLNSSLQRFSNSETAHIMPTIKSQENNLEVAQMQIATNALQSITRAELETRITAKLAEQVVNPDSVNVTTAKNAIKMLLGSQQEKTTLSSYFGGRKEWVIPEEKLADAVVAISMLDAYYQKLKLAHNQIRNKLIQEIKAQIKKDNPHISDEQQILQLNQRMRRREFISDLEQRFLADSTIKNARERFDKLSPEQFYRLNMAKKRINEVFEDTFSATNSLEDLMNRRVAY